MSDETINLYKEASRRALRFFVTKGTVNIASGVMTVEDLWDLKLEQLNAIAVQLHNEIKETGEVSFIDDQPQANIELQLKLDIVKDVIAEKKAEKAAAQAAADRRAMKAKLLAIRDQKRDSQLQELSLEEIEQQLAQLS